MKITDFNGCQIETNFNSFSAWLKPEQKVFVIYDSNARNIKKTIVQKYLDKNHCACFEIGASESIKNFCTVIQLCEWLEKFNCSRTDVIVNIGGGIITDIGGFVATIFKRGIQFVNIPTTLVGMVDAAIGGKNGINSLNCKNMVGTINQPKFIEIDQSYLKSLPMSEIRNGMFEMLKTSLVCDTIAYKGMVELFSKIVQDPDNSKSDGEIKDTFFFYICRTIINKLSIVKKDCKEDPNSTSPVSRKILNFGHTVGHVIEASNLNTIKHGEAIAYGILFVTKLTNLDLYFKLARDFAFCGLNTISTRIKIDCTKLLNDKKANDKTIDLVTISEIGVPAIIQISIEKLMSYIQNDTMFIFD